MRSLIQPRRLAAGSRRVKLGFLLSLLFLPAVLSAQDVHYTAPGSIGLTVGTAKYNGQYVLIQSDFGFFWLDLTNPNNPFPGHVQAISKCAPWPPSDSNYYVSGDCNGISDIHTNGSLVLVRNLSGNCAGGMRSGSCSGPRTDSHTYLLFGLGTWGYQGDGSDIGDSSQSADLQGRTWTITKDPAWPPPDATHFIWHASGNPTAPPTAGVTATNVSASGRSDKTNYFGDVWSLKDTSSAISPVTQIQWDYNYLAPNFTIDRQGTPGETVSIYFPCDQNTSGNPGNPNTGQNCSASVGGTAGSYLFSLNATNQYGTTQYASPAINVALPQVQIAGFASGTLRVLSGGNADASTTQGNPTAFNWNFTPGGAPSCTQPCRIVAVPAGAQTFTLQVTYAGYSPALVSGSVVQSDLVPAFSLTPNPVLISTNLTLTNQMQVSVGTTVTAVAYTIKLGTTTVSSGNLASSFLTQNGTAQVTAPATSGSYTIDLVYTFNGPQGNGQTAAAPTASFSATNWAPNPQISISPLPFCGSGSCQITTGTAYGLSDVENIIISPHPGAQWDLISSSGTTSLGSSADANTPITWTPTAVCSGCTLRLTVSGVLNSLPVTISNPVVGPPPGPSVTISGPTSLTAGQAATFSANVSNATGTVSYTWAFDDTGVQSGTSSISHSWASSGSHSVTVGISAANGTASTSLNVSVTGNPAPRGDFAVAPGTLSGSTLTVGRGVEVTFASNEQYASQWGWVFGDGTSAGGASSRTAKKTYGSLGTYSGSLQVWGDSTHTTGYVATPFTVIVTIPDPSTAFTAQNATQNLLTGNYDAYAGATLTFTAAETRAANWGWDFGDGSPVAGKTVTHVFSSTGSYTAHLLVYGDGVNTANGPAVANFTFNVTRSPFQAMIVPGAAHLDDGTNTWGTDLSISNAGTGAITINLAFLPFLSDAFAPTTQDLSSLTFGAPLALPTGGSWSATDVVSYLNGGNSKGTVVIKYSGGSAAPLVSARVYFQPKTNPGNISYGSGIPAYNINGAGQISAQGIGSSSSSGSPTGLAEKGSEALEGTITVSKTGTGSGRVSSTPAGIDCGSTCSGAFTPSTSSPVLLAGYADSGSVFVGFTAGCDFQFQGQCAITSSSATVTAQFDATAPPGNSTLTVSKTGTGSGTVSSNPAGIDCGSTCSASFAPTSNVTLTATAGSGSAFAGWSGACAGTGASCVVSMATSQSVNATFTGSGPPPPTASADQVLIGLTATPRYRFGVTLFNAAGAKGNFRIAAMDEESSPLLIDDGTGTNHLVAYRDFDIAPFQQVYLTNDLLGLNDSNRRYVLKGTRNSSNGTLLAFGSALDRSTRDLVQITDDGQAAPDEAGLINYWVAGVSRYDTTYGAHWRTDLRIYNRGSRGRNLYFEYTFLSGGIEHVARVSQVRIAAGELLTYDDVVKSLMTTPDTSADLSGSNAGFLHIFYSKDDDSATKPLIISSRNYDDQTTGTAGSQLALYTRAHGGSSTKKLFAAGAEDSLRYATKIGVFAMDPGPVSFRIVAVDSNGTEVGSLSTGLGGAGAHFGQIDLTDAAFNFTNPGKPVTIRIDSISGGRVGAYVFTVDKVTLDTNFVQALPQP